MVKTPQASKVGRRTRREMPYQQRSWQLVEKWTQENGFTLVERDGERQRYRCRIGWIMPAAFVELRREGERIILEAWIRSDQFLVVNIMTQQEPEIRLDQGGISAAMPRMLMRRRLNPLLAKLGQPLIF